MLRGLDTDLADLIYLDPPFNSNRRFDAPIGSAAEGASFDDTWRLSDVKVAEVGLLADDHPALADYIRIARSVHGDPMAAYLTFMALRLIELKRVLKPSGAIYLHCDSYAGHYLKGLMDAIFGRKNFRNEIVWCYGKSSNSKAAKFLRGHDTILFYAASPDYSHNELFDDEVSPRKKQLIAAGYNTKRMNGDRYLYIYDEEKVLEKEAAGKLNRDDFDIIRTVDASKGNRLTDVFNINILNSQAAENLGYPTQKPVKLLERIIAASSSPGDLVLDPFCGCATTCDAAEELRREWIGIDLSPKAADLMERRMQKRHGIFGQVIHRTDLPRRTDLEPVPHYRTNARHLYGAQEGYCAGCGCHFEFRHLEVDHIVPQSKGGGDHLDNLQLLCGHCNRIKGQRPMAALVAALAEVNAARSRSL